MAWRWPCLAAPLAALALAGCDDPPLGGLPPGTPVRTWFAPCPRLEGTYALTQRPLHAPLRSDNSPWDELSIEAEGDQGLRFTWRDSDRPDPSVTLRLEPDQVARYRWSIGQDEGSDEAFLQTVYASRGLLGNGHSLVVRRREMRCDNGWLAVPYAPGSPTWPAGLNRSAQFTVDRQGALIADFSVHAAERGFFTPSSLWCGRACRDWLNNGHDVHAWIRAPRTLGSRPASLELAYDEGPDVMGGAVVSSDAVREHWRSRLAGLRARLVRVRMSDSRVELTFAANDRQALAAGTAAMRHLDGLRNVVVRRYSGGTASPQTLAITADADPPLLAALR